MFTDINDMRFKNLTQEDLTIKDVEDLIRKYIYSDKNAKYNITIGTDSQTDTETRMVLVICVCREGKGGIFFTHMEKHNPVNNLRNKIYNETSLSLSVAEHVKKIIHDMHINYTFSVHADIGQNGPTKELINEIVGWIVASGYNCEIKPNSYAASTIANKYSK